MDQAQQMATFTYWWQRNKPWVGFFLGIPLVCFIAWMWWGTYQQHQLSKAACLYGEMQKNLDSQANGKVLRIAQDIQQVFGRTPYASMASLLAAKTAFETKDLGQAKSLLMWVVSHGYDDIFKALARVRLAGLLLDEKAYDDALSFLEGKVSPVFGAAFADRRGDILVAQKKFEEARLAYKQGLEFLLTLSSKQILMQNMLQVKLDALG